MRQRGGGSLIFVSSFVGQIACPTPQSALYLASDSSSFTTGTAMLVDGGISVHG